MRPDESDSQGTRTVFSTRARAVIYQARLLSPEAVVPPVGHRRESVDVVGVEVAESVEQRRWRVAGRAVIHQARPLPQSVSVQSARHVTLVGRVWGRPEPPRQARSRMAVCPPTVSRVRRSGVAVRSPERSGSIARCLVLRYRGVSFEGLPGRWSVECHRRVCRSAEARWARCRGSGKCILRLSATRYYQVANCHFLLLGSNGSHHGGWPKEGRSCKRDRDEGAARWEASTM